MAGPSRGLASELQTWVAKWRWYERSSLPWNRAAIHWQLMRRRAFARWPLHGNVLEALREGRLTIGEGTLLEPGVWITAPGQARVRIGQGVFLNLGVMIAAQELVEIGDHCMLANGCFVSDASHSYDDPEKPVTWQGFSSKGPTRIGANCWLGANVVVGSGVSIGERCVIGANSVVTSDVEPFTVAAGAPARPLRKIEYATIPTDAGEVDYVSNEAGGDVDYVSNEAGGDVDYVSSEAEGDGSGEASSSRSASSSAGSIE